MASQGIIVALYRKRLNVVLNVDLVAGDYLIEKGDGLILSHVGNT
jgi:hypothetical protein